MDGKPLLGMTTEQIQRAATDPWKWDVFHYFTVAALKDQAPWFVVLLVGMIAAVAYRRRCPVVARRVLIGCVGLLLGRLAEILFFTWIWPLLDPDPAAPYRPVRGWPIGTVHDGIGLGVATLLVLTQAGCLAVLISAVLYGRAERPRGEVE